MSGWRHALSWFPGHAAKATREIATRLRQVDIVVEVRDARAPRSTGSSQLERIVRSSAKSDHRLIVLNKVDLISKAHRAKIERWMAADHPGVPFFFTSAKEQTNGKAHGVRELLDAAVDQVRTTSPRLFQLTTDRLSAAPSAAAQAIVAKAANGGQLGAETTLPLIMMVVGVPNVGKSSLINAFRRLSVSDQATSSRFGPRRGGASRSRKPARTGALPGVTTALGGFQVSWEPNVWMLDTPGVLTPRVDGGWEAALRLGVLDLIKYDHTAVEGLGAYALYHLASLDEHMFKQWPNAHRVVVKHERRLTHTPLGMLTDPDSIVGSGPDPLAGKGGGGASVAAVGGSGADGSVAVVDGAICPTERFALRLLTGVAEDLNFKAKTGFRIGDISTIPDTIHAAKHILKQLRGGRLGPLCFDVHPPHLDSRGTQSAKRQDLPRGIIRKRRLR